MTTQDKIDGEKLAYEIVEFARTRTGSPQTFLAALQFLDGWRAVKEIRAARDGAPTVDNRGSMPQLQDV